MPSPGTRHTPGTRKTSYTPGQERMKDIYHENAITLRNMFSEMNVPEDISKMSYKAKPTTVNFTDEGTINNFVGVFFKNSNGDYYNLPPELENSFNMRRHDDGTISVNPVQVFREPEHQQANVPMRHGMQAPASIEEMRNWDTRRISNYLLNETENYQALYACIIAQLRNDDSPAANTAIQQLSALMNTESGIEHRHEGLDTKFAEMDLSEKRGRGSPKKGSPTSTRKRPTESRMSQPSATSSEEKLRRLIDMYTEALNKKDERTVMALTDSINRLGNQLGIDFSTEGMKWGYFGFGRSSLQPNRRRRRGSKLAGRRMSRLRRRRVARRMSMSVAKRGVRRVARRTSRRVARRTSRRGFGSTIYGLQGGGSSYNGVNPMSFKVSETLPNLNNVVRTYKLNEFGKIRSRSRIKSSRSRIKSSRSRNDSRTQSVKLRKIRKVSRRARKVSRRSSRKLRSSRKKYRVKNIA